MPKTVWYKNGIELQSSDKTDLAKVTVKASASTETATYQCVAKNDLGQVSSSAQFLVLGTFCVIFKNDIYACLNVCKLYCVAISPIVPPTSTGETSRPLGDSNQSPHTLNTILIDL